NNSISGTMLLHCRVFKHLNNQEKFVFRNAEKLKYLLKTFVPLLIFTLGGHSFHEFLYPLNHPTIIKNFSFINDFKKQFNLRALFFDDMSQEAFHRALEQAIKYNNQFLLKQMLHNQLKTVTRSMKLR